MSIQYNRHFGRAIGVEEQRFSCFCPLTKESGSRFNTLMLEQVQGLQMSKQDLVEFLHSTLRGYGFYELYIVGGSAQ
ncbi:MAG: hypothetical protein FJZ60_02305, partial [Chlamydiae bacterium]|nr:hypothetical protein [Chlamydiota bacterium]